MSAENLIRSISVDLRPQFVLSLGLVVCFNSPFQVASFSYVVASFMNFRLIEHCHQGVRCIVHWCIIPAKKARFGSGYCFLLYRAKMCTFLIVVSSVRDR